MSIMCLERLSAMASSALSLLCFPSFDPCIILKIFKINIVCIYIFILYDIIYNIYTHAHPSIVYVCVYVYTHLGTGIVYIRSVENRAKLIPPMRVLNLVKLFDLLRHFLPPANDFQGGSRHQFCPSSLNLFPHQKMQKLLPTF